MGHSFLGGLDDKLSGFLSTSHEACSNSFSQVSVFFYYCCCFLFCKIVVEIVEDFSLLVTFGSNGSSSLYKNGVLDDISSSSLVECMSY